MRGDDHVGLEGGDLVDGSALAAHTGEPRPGTHERVVDRRRARGHSHVRSERFGRTLVEEDQQVGDQPVTAREIDHAPPADSSMRATRDLPRLVQLFAREALDLAQHPRHALEQRIARKPPEIVPREHVAARRMERHAAVYREVSPRSFVLNAATS